MMSANEGGVLIDQGVHWFTDCEGVGSKGARRGFLLGGPRLLSTAVQGAALPLTPLWCGLQWFLLTVTVGTFKRLGRHCGWSMGRGIPSPSN